MSNKHKKVYRFLSYIEHLLILIFTVTGYASISALASLVDITIKITSYTIGLKNFAITVWIKN